MRGNLASYVRLKHSTVYLESQKSVGASPTVENEGACMVAGMPLLPYSPQSQKCASRFTVCGTPLRPDLT